MKTRDPNGVSLAVLGYAAGWLFAVIILTPLTASEGIVAFILLIVGVAILLLAR